MKLIAVWIENYMNLKNVGFNFGDNLHFIFDYESEDRFLKINVEKTLDYFDLFKGSKIENVSGILGNNGSGKTSLLKFINTCESKSPIVYGAVLIFKLEGNENNYVCYNYGNIFKSNKIQVGADKSISELIGKNSFKIQETDNPFNNMNVLFYSNLYSDHNDNYLKSENELNRSVDYLTLKSLNRFDIKEYLDRFNKISDNVVGKETSFNVLKLYFEERFKRLIGFISSIKTDHTELQSIVDAIPFPEWLNINYNENLFERANELAQRSLYDFKKLKDVINFSLKELEKLPDLGERFRKELVLKLFCYAFKDDLFQNTQPVTTLKELENFVKNLALDERIFDNLLNYMSEKKNERMFYQISKLSVIFNKLRNNTYNIQIDIDRILSLYVYKVKVTNNVWEFIKDITDLSEIDYEPFITFRWHSLSAGQEALLNQFMELWYGLKNRDKNSLLINIDEGELYLHPEWQRQYINLLYKFLDYSVNLYDDLNHVQVLVTSHSPFIASDIPKHNLVFLKRENANANSTQPKVTIVNSQIQEPTFGGNIFDLYKHSFFVDHFIGAFSTKWIEEAFKYANGEPSNFKSESEVRSFLKLVGEKVLKDVLESSLLETTNNEYEIIDLNAVAVKKLGLGKKAKKRVSKKKQAKKGKR